jgi:hypothetical protein
MKCNLHWNHEFENQLEKTIARIIVFEPNLCFESKTSHKYQMFSNWFKNSDANLFLNLAYKYHINSHNLSQPKQVWKIANKT